MSVKEKSQYNAGPREVRGGVVTRLHGDGDDRYPEFCNETFLHRLRFAKKMISFSHNIW